VCVTIINGTAGDDVLLVQIGSITGVSSNSSYRQSGPGIAFSPDGWKMAFQAFGDNIVPGVGSKTSPEVYIEDLRSGVVSVLSTDSSGHPANSFAANPLFSADGTSVAFNSWATNLPGSGYGGIQIYLKNLNTGVVTAQSVTPGGVHPDANTWIDGFAGGKIFFQSGASNLGASDGLGHEYVKDLSTGAITLLPHTAGAYAATVSADGSQIAFLDSTQRAYVMNVATGVATLVSTALNGASANSYVSALALSADGTKVAFSTHASNLVAGDINGVDDIFVKDLQTGVVTLVSADASGHEGNWASFRPVFSPDGSKIAFTSYANNLVAGDSNGDLDAFVKDLTTGEVTLVSVSNTGQQSVGANIENLTFSPDGSRIAFTGDDVLTPGAVAGDITLYVKTMVTAVAGGAGADTFVLAPGQGGHAVISDFSSAQGDKLDLNGFTAIHTLTNLLAHAVQSGPDTVINFDDSSSLTLSNVTAVSLTAAQFLFSPGSTPVPPADFNHDAVSDVLLRNNTTGDFGYMALTPLGGASWHAVGGSDASYGVFAVADFNGDGASDMLLRNDTTGDVGFMDMTPGGGPVWHDIGGSAVSYTVQGTGDFNGDHVTDMLWRNDTTGDVGYTALTSSGGAGWVHLGNSSTAYTVEGTGDFNGDGVSDLLFRNDSTGDVGYTALTPSGGARWVYLGGSATAYAVQGSGDFNGDGVSDLLFRNQITGDYGYTALTRSGGASWHALGVSDPTYAIVATGDFNGDGRADVLQRNATTGDYGYMATTSSTGVWHDIGTVASGYFVVA
jgi:Tol biopolymer transport system component